MILVSIIVVVLGWLSTVMSCGLPMWRVMKFPEDEMGQAVSMWEGLWSMCHVEGLAHMQCAAYHSLVAVPVGLQVSRALIICIVTTSLGLLPLLVLSLLLFCFRILEGLFISALWLGMDRWVCGIFLGSGLMMMVSMSLATYNFIQGFSNPFLGSSQETDMGASVYLGWVGTVLILLGGILLWRDRPDFCACPCFTKDSAERSTPASSA